MEFRYLGRSGLKISEITYGNWLTHGSQVENDVATACVHAALDAGITTFDTADVYANGAAEEVLGEALAGQRREVAGDLHQGVLARPGPRATTTAACPASTSWSRSTARCAGCGPTTSTSTRRTATTPRPRWRRRCRPSPTSSARARRSTSGSASGPPSRSAQAHDAGPRAGHPAGLQPAAVLDAVAGHRGRGGARPAEELGHRPDRLVADRAGRAHRQVPAGQPPPAGSRATDDKGGANFDPAVHDATTC